VVWCGVVDEESYRKPEDSSGYIEVEMRTKEPKFSDRGGFCAFLAARHGWVRVRVRVALRPGRVESSD
jgi:hypothetical protein